MVDVWLPYGKTEVCARIPTRNFLGVIEPKEKPGLIDPRAEIERALIEPIGSPQLGEIVKPGDKVAIVVDDTSRTTLSHLMVTTILDELRKTGIKDEGLTIIFASGSKRDLRSDDIEKLVGEETLKRVKTVSHDPESKDHVHLGKTSFGTRVYVNEAFAEADVKILTGGIGLHCFAGYDGGRKSLLRISSVGTQRANHAMVLHPKARMGVLEGNPTHEDMTEAAKLAKVDFILNAVTNSRQELVKAFAGDLEQAFYEGVKLEDEIYKVPIQRRADIVVVGPGGHPFDVNLFQACKGVTSAAESLKRRGVIVLVAECPEGHGNDVFHDWMAKFESLHRMEREIKRSFVYGGHKAYYLTKALQRAQIILVSIMPDYQALNVFRLRTARAVNDALREAFNIAGKNTKVWVIPHGSITLPVMKTAEQR